MTNLKKHVALLLAIILTLTLIPAELAIASTRTYTLSRGGFTMEFRVVSAWNTGYNAEIILTNNTAQGLYQWVLNLNRDMGLTANAQGAWLAHQAQGVTTLGYMDWNSYIPAGGRISIWLTNTSTNGVVPVPTDFRLNQATRRRVPSADYTHEVNHHSGWAGRFGLGLSTVIYDVSAYCEKCNVGLVQKDDFLLKKSPSWGRRDFFSLTWVYDEIFLSDKAEAVFKENKVTGIEFRDVRCGMKKREIIQNTKQIIVSNRLKPGLPKTMIE